MAEITAALVKQLREETQLPMMDCKAALTEAGGDVEAAKKALREKGKVLMASRADRSTEEGRVAIYTSPKVGAIVELQCESAPVAGSDEFSQLANDLAEQLATGPGANTAEELWAQPSPRQKGKTLQDVKDELENKIREVFRLSRLMRIEAASGGYVHHDGRTGVLLEIEGSNDALAREISMHVAAMKPQAVNKDALDKSAVEQERQTQMERARQEGKPENIIEKMIEGRMRNFFSEVVLEEQAFIKDDKQTVGKIAAEGGLKLKNFTMWRLGE